MLSINAYNWQISVKSLVVFDLEFGDEYHEAVQPVTGTVTCGVWMLLDAERGPQTYLSAAAAAGVFRSGTV